MAEIIQGQEPEAFPPSTPGNGPQSRGTKQSFVADPIKDTPSGQTSIRKGAGPRTAQVAERTNSREANQTLIHSEVVTAPAEQFRAPFRQFPVR